MRLSLDAWSIAAIALIATGGFLLFYGEALGLKGSLGVWAIIAGVATTWGRDGYSNQGSLDSRKLSMVMFWLAIAVLAINLFVALR